MGKTPLIMTVPKMVMLMLLNQRIVFEVVSCFRGAKNSHTATAVKIPKKARILIVASLFMRFSYHNFDSSVIK